MKINDSYVKAIYDLMVEEKNLDELIKLSKQLIQNFEEQPRIVDFLLDYSVDIKEKEEFLKKIVKNKNILNWFMILISDKEIKGIFIYLKKIIHKYNVENNISEGIIWTTKLLQSKEITQMEKIFSEKNNKKVHLENKIDKEIIGGIKVELDNKIWDNSVIGQLHNLVEKLIKEKN